MPNWCEGSLVVRGNEKDLKKFYKLGYTKDKYTKEKKGDRDCVLDTEKFVPFPKEWDEQEKEFKDFQKLKEKEKKNVEFSLKEKKRWILYQLNPKKYNELLRDKEWYEWDINNYGTKWGICHSGCGEKDFDKGILSYYFDTAWSPCEPVVFKMSEMFPKLNFNYKYWERGMGFRGILICKGGKILKNKTYDYRGQKGG